MKRGVQLGIALAFALILGLRDTHAASLHQGPATPNGTGAAASQGLKGQTRTLLSDGTWLIVGGEGEHGPLGVAAIRDPSLNRTGALPSSLHHARAWHTATSPSRRHSSDLGRR